MNVVAVLSTLRTEHRCCQMHKVQNTGSSASFDLSSSNTVSNLTKEKSQFL